MGQGHGQDTKLPVADRQQEEGICRSEKHVMSFCSGGYKRRLSESCLLERTERREMLPGSACQVNIRLPPNQFRSRTIAPALAYSRLSLARWNGLCAYGICVFRPVLSPPLDAFSLS